MSFEERMSVLAERHEALTQSAGLLRHESEKHDHQIGQLARIAAATNESIIKLANSVDALVHIAENHERRIIDINGDTA